MTLEILDYSSGDIPDITSWVPTSREEVFVQLTINIGERGNAGGYLFQLMVVTPEGLRAFAQKYPNLDFPNRALIVFSDYTWDIVVQRLRKIVAHCTRDTWQQSVACLQRYFEWEYEDYNVVQ
jgi:hypothetical protein